jgi:amidohydrolase
MGRMARTLTALSPERVAMLKERVRARVDELAAELIALADDIHAHPELGYQERRTVAKVQDLLALHGVQSRTGLAGLPTALRAELGGERRPKVAIIAEYDALPGLGHACGHNTICVAAVGAALALKDVLPETHGSAVLLGTPAEESAVDNAGGKIHVLRAGGLDDVDAAMMVHPLDRDGCELGSSLAARGIVFEFHGKPAHAAASPHLGVNALDALIHTFVGIGLLRQQVRADARIHGIVTHGGDAPNIIPKYAAGRFRVRASDLTYMNELTERVVAVARGAAEATGCRFEHHDFAPTYEDVVPNAVLADRLAASFEEIGRPMATTRPTREGMGSTDFGNVSRRVPAFCPYVKISDEGIQPHTVEFERAAASESAHRMILDSAKAMAMAALELLADPSLIDKAKEELKERLSRGNA